MVLTIVSVNGNIGSGKSTLLSAIEASSSSSSILKIVPEPIEEWCRPVLEDGSCSMLKAFYDDSTGVAFTFQMYVLLTRVQQIREELEKLDDALDAVLGVERGPWVDLDLMGVPIRESGAMTDMEWYVYESWHRAVLETLPAMSAYVYLCAPPEQCMERVESRGRSDEKSGIDLEYLRRVHESHEAYMDTCAIPKLLVPSEEGMQHGAAAATRAQAVLGFIDKITSSLG